MARQLQNALPVNYNSQVATDCHKLLDEHGKN